MMELDHHYLSNTSYNCLRQKSSTDGKLSGQKYNENSGVYVVSKLSPLKVLINYEGKNSHCTLKKIGRQHLNQMIKVSVTSDGTN